MPPRKVALIAALVALLLLPSVASAGTEAQLRTALQRETAKLGPSSGAMVVDASTGEQLFARRPDLKLVPASNEKLYTTAAALMKFGADGRLVTELRGVEPDAEGVVSGSLYLVGDGDPSLGDTGLRRIVDELREAGVKKVTGGVVGDGSVFDARAGGPDSGFAADLDLGGWLGGLVIKHGDPTPGGPAKVAAARLQALLKAKGVTFEKAATAGTTPASAVQLATAPSPTMAALAATVNQPSDNFYAEMLLKALGATAGTPATTARGVAVARTQLAKVGVTSIMSDGSGLSRANRTSPRQLIALLRAMDRHEAGEAFSASLARFGQAGTLRRRLRGTTAASRCRAKTGTLRNVSALSGFCATSTGRTIAFSFVENGVYPPAAKKVEDRMTRAIAALSE